MCFDHSVLGDKCMQRILKVRVYIYMYVLGITFYCIKFGDALTSPTLKEILIDD